MFSASLHALTFADENRLADELIARARFSDDETQRIDALARHLVEGARARRGESGRVDPLMAEYGLSSEEGIVLMGLAEALVLIPDDETVDAFITDKLSGH